MASVEKHRLAAPIESQLEVTHGLTQRSIVEIHAQQYFEPEIVERRSHRLGIRTRVAQTRNVAVVLVADHEGHAGRTTRVG